MNIESLTYSQLLELLRRVDKAIAPYIERGPVEHLNQWFIRDKRNRSVEYIFKRSTCFVCVKYYTFSYSVSTTCATQKQSKAAVAREMIETLKKAGVWGEVIEKSARVQVDCCD